MPASRRRARPRIEPIRWIGGPDGYLRILDQTLLPHRVRRLALRRVDQVVEAIRALRVRGAPLIGIAAAYGMVLAARRPASLEASARRLARARPTAVNLAAAVRRVRRVLGRRPTPARALAEARAIHREDAEACRRIGRAGAPLVRGNVLTICNTGHLATGGTGTAFAVLLRARPRRIFVCETRPLNQGARLTLWEARRCGLRATLVCDSAAGALMQRGLVGCVVTGADRIAANGDTANKIGTYALAVLARAHGIPFYVAAPSSTIDRRLRSGRRIPIEVRSPREIAPWTDRALNPAFDVTPARLIDGWITEAGTVRPPFR
jgi:methylthioribose-1-phosphate isomerase